MHRVPRVVLDRTLPGVTHQGVFAGLRPQSIATPVNFLKSWVPQVGTPDKPLVLGFDAVEDPRNLGAILRTAECAGVGGVFIPERRAAGLTATVAKLRPGRWAHFRGPCYQPGPIDRAVERT